MTLFVRPVQSRSDLRRFIDVPWSLHASGGHAGWVPPLRMTVRDAVDAKDNPFYRDASRALFIAERHGHPVGRIAAIENRAHNRFHGDRTGFFGFYECVDDVEASSALLSAAAEWLSSRGLATMRGPMNPSTNYECGVLVAGFEEPVSFMTPWNPPYYDALLRASGVAPVQDLLAFWFTTPADDEQPPFVVRQAKRALEKGRVTFRDLDPSKFESEVAVLWELYNAAWENNWGFVPMSHAEFHHMAKDMKQLLDPRFAFLASVDGEPAGFLLALPDYNEVLIRNPSGRLFPFGALRMLFGKTRIGAVRVMALGVKPAFRSRSILALLTHEVMRRANRHGKRGGEASWLLEDNQLIVKPMRAMGAAETRRWRIYERVLPGAKT